MDLDQLLQRYRISRMRAETATCVEARLAHIGLARGYADRIAQMRRELALGAAPAHAR